MSGIAVGRLTQERKDWRKDHPLNFYARPQRNADNSNDMMNWEAGIPGKIGTDWEGGVYKLTMQFPDEYPMKPPKCQFVPPLFHPNIYQSGRICLSIINEDTGWRPAITIKDMLLGFQDLLDNPNTADPAHFDAYQMYEKDLASYRGRIKAQALKFVPDT